MAAHVARLTRPRFVSRLLIRTAHGMRDAIRGRSRMRPPTDYGERTLVRERDLGGHPIVATTHALYHYPGPDVAPGRHFHGKVHPHAGAHPIPPGWRRLGWEEIAKVSWDSVRLVLTATGLPGRRAVAALGPAAAIDLYLVRRSRLVDLARDRVAATLVVSRRVPVAEGGTVLVTGRRRPGSTTVTWVVFSGTNGTGPDPYLVRAQVQEAIRALRAELHI